MMLVMVNGLAFWSVARTFSSPFPSSRRACDAFNEGDLGLSIAAPSPGHEAGTIGTAFNSMAQAVEDKVQAERQVREVEARLE